MSLPLSVLDLSPISSGSTAHDALWGTVRLAEAAERLGYTRYWLAEHHNAGAVASSAPEVLIGLVASKTRSIRVGSGGIMLPNHSPLKVAELFRVLEALFPGRIDLGIGRAAGTDPRTAVELRRGKPLTSEDEFVRELATLEQHLAYDGPPRAPFSRSTIAIPVGVRAAPIHLLGSSDYGATLAAKLGMPFAFAAHMNPADAAAELSKYRASFRPSHRGDKPYAIVSVAAVCAETDEEASRLARSAELGWIHFAQGRRDEPMPSADEAAAHQDDESQASLREMFKDRLIVGSPGRVLGAVAKVASDCAADEVMILTHVHEPAARIRSYELIARAFGVAPRR